MTSLDQFFTILLIYEYMNEGTSGKTIKSWYILYKGDGRKSVCVSVFRFIAMPVFWHALLSLFLRVLSVHARFSSFLTVHVHSYV